ncbi:uncharacterized protein LOC123681066 [Harmonia axyridis]|uniref:uncharacterized protein LOC123681066 n=1 Tax=Harmonia axyridis TaxID=115357 RepID=UPI001E2783C6|nr:uncharacterized protein LOC123681066 [Harmonia axyridis]
MLTAQRYLSKWSFINQCLNHRTKYGAPYSQRTDVDECDCKIHQPKCKKRPEVVREVNCEKCMFECWEYKPRPKFAPKKSETEYRKPIRECSADMRDPEFSTLKKEKKQAAICQHKNRTEAPKGHCPKVFKGTLTKSCMENPYKFEQEKVPLPDWDYKQEPPSAPP